MSDSKRLEDLTTEDLECMSREELLEVWDQITATVETVMAVLQEIAADVCSRLVPVVNAFMVEVGAAYEAERVRQQFPSGPLVPMSGRSAFQSPHLVRGPHQMRGNR